jgi:hypothetical protein
MKNIFIYGSLIILFSSCGRNSNTSDENNSEGIVANEDIKSHDNSENIIIEEVTETPAKDNNCSESEIRAYLNDPDNSGTNIRKSPSGEIVTQLVKDDVNIEFFLTLTEAQDGWFKVKSPIVGMENDFEIPNDEGWIHGSVISVDTRNYGGESLELLDNPINGNVVGIIEGESYGLRIKDMCGEWVKVEYKGTIGWVEDAWLCGNPLTTCS